MAHAAAILDLHSMIRLEIVNLPMGVTAEVGDPDTLSIFEDFGTGATGSTSVTPDPLAASSLSVGDYFKVTTDHLLIAETVPLHDAVAEAISFQLLSLTNNNVDAADVTIKLDFDYSMEAMADDLGSEIAFGGLDMFVDSLFFGTALDIFRTTTLAPPDNAFMAMDAGTFNFTVEVPGGETDEIVIVNDSFGSVFSDASGPPPTGVPEPSTILLLLTGVALVRRAHS